MSAEWTVVDRRQKHRHQHGAVVVPRSAHVVASSSLGRLAPSSQKHQGLFVDELVLNSCTPTVRQALQPIIVRLQKCYDTLLQSDFLRQFEQALKYVEAQELIQLPEEQIQTAFCWKHIHQLQVYGLGSPSSRGDKVTCSQLAFACWLRTKLPKLQNSIAVDPVFNCLDRQLLHALKFQVPEHEVEHAVSIYTLFFMPHCPRSLYNAVLRENWTSQQLQQVLILGNSFRNYAQPSVLRSRDAVQPYHLLEVISSSTAWELAISEADYPVTSAFNDLSLHLFPEWKIARTSSPPA